MEKAIFFLKKNFNKKDILFLFLIIGLFFLTRLVNLEKFPIFSDEGIYIQWAKTAWHDASWRFISLTDGKQPLQTWGTIPFLKLLPDNALFAGRLFAVSTGLAALIGIFCLLFYVFNKKTAYIGSLLYIFTPYFIFYDRLALSDSGVNAAFIWILFFSILLAKTIRLDVALIFGLIGGISLLTKSSAQVFIGLAAIGPILFLFNKQGLRSHSGKKASAASDAAEALLNQNLNNDSGRGLRPCQNDDEYVSPVNRTINYYFLYLITVSLAFAIYNIQRLSPFLHFVAEKNKVFLLSFSEFIKSPFQLFFHNLTTLPLYVSWEMGFALALTGLIGWFFLFKKDRNLFVYLSLWIILLYIGVSLFTIILYPRYLMFFASLFLITTAYLLSYLKNKVLNFILIAALTSSLLFFNYYILFDISNIPFPPVDRGQYLEGWTAGWGIREIVDYARERTQEKPVVILAEGSFGMTGDVLNVHIKPDDRIFVKGYWPLTQENIAENYQELKKSIVLVAISHQDKPLIAKNMILIKRFEKPGNKSAIYLFELK